MTESGGTFITFVLFVCFSVRKEEEGEGGEGNLKKFVGFTWFGGVQCLRVKR